MAFRLSTLALAVCLCWPRVGTVGAARAEVPRDEYEMRLTCDPSAGRMEGHMTLRYTNDTAKPLQMVRLRLDANLSAKQSLEIQSVQDGVGKALAWHYEHLSFAKFKSDHGAVEITLAQALAPAAQTIFSLRFLEKGSHLNEEMIVLQDDPFQSLDAWYPKAMTHVGDKWSIDDDRPSSYAVRLSLPKGYTVASTGRRLAESGPGDRQELELRAERVRGFSIYASPRWQRSVRRIGHLDLGICLPADATSWADRLLDVAGDAVAFYEKEYAPFPARNLDIICPGSLNEPAHGSSAACNVMVIYLGGRLEEQYRFLVAHEVAHQYFGAGVGLPRTSIGWVPVGLGLMMDEHYAAARGFDATYGRRIMKDFYFRAEKMKFDTTLSQSVERPLCSPPPWSFGWNMSLAHGKAYAVCAMLRDLLGPAKFQHVIRELIKSKAGDVVRDQDLLDACETAFGDKLDWFKADWVDGRVMFDYAVKTVKKEGNGWDVTVSRLGTGRFPVQVEAKTNDGGILRQRIAGFGAEEVVHFATAGALKSVSVNPDSVYPDLDAKNDLWTATE